MNSCNNNMKSTLSERGQITIPKKLREQLGLRQGQHLDFEIQDGVLIGRKGVVGDPVRDVTGILNLDLDVDRALEESRGPKWSLEFDADRS
jgi:AbrB family looped-hinge helix DNA binding protein